MFKNRRKELELYNWAVKNFSVSVDDWFLLRKTKEDIGVNIDNFGAVGRSISKHYLAKETKLITTLTTVKFKLRLEIFESGSGDSKKKIIILKHGGPLSSMEDMMFEQYPNRTDRRSLNKGVGKMLKHLLDKNFI